MRARYPDREGLVERDGVKVGFELYGRGGAGGRGGSGEAWHEEL